MYVYLKLFGRNKKIIKENWIFYERPVFDIIKFVKCYNNYCYNSKMDNCTDLTFQPKYYILLAFKRRDQFFIHLD